MHSETASTRDAAGFCAGLLLVFVYWLSVHPPGFGTFGHSEDLCWDSMRIAAADMLEDDGRFSFVTQRMMYPEGGSVAFLPWSMERDWLGAYFWRWWPEFPYLWAFLGLSLAAAYTGVGVILRGMDVKPPTAWAIAAAVTLFHVPRHFRAYYHYEQLLLHWLYWSIFLDAWIWQRAWRERRWSWNLELWRGACLFGMLMGYGYVWGPLLIEWAITHVCLAGLWLAVRRSDASLKLDGTLRGALAPLAVTAAIIGAELFWFPPLYAEVRRLGPLVQTLGWFPSFWTLFEPLWLVQSLDPQTSVAIGWLYWGPLLAGIILALRRKGARGIVDAAPMLLFLYVMVRYMVPGDAWAPEREWIRRAVPFMSFFRVAIRAALIVPPVAGAAIVLFWPLLAEWARSLWRQRRTLGVAWAACALACLAALEVSWLAHPVIAMQPLEADAERFFGRLREAPGRAVLDLPFCMVGGNTGREQCPQYPESTTPICMRRWHRKAVYGGYLSRMAESQSRLYDRPPYRSWFSAWTADRCFSSEEWEGFCHHLGEHEELAAVVVYPDLWRAAGERECRRLFSERLGEPLDESSFDIQDGSGQKRTRVVRYAARCRVSR